MVSKKDREEYEEGHRDREKGVFDQALINIPEPIIQTAKLITRADAANSLT